MKHRARILACAAAVTVLGVGIWLHMPTQAARPTTLSFRVGQTFEEVVGASTYAVMQHSNKPSDTIDLGGDIFVTKPAVILRFNDPQHGFTLPPTKFAFIGISDNKVVTASTSPMLDNLPFDEALAVLENLQNQFKAGGWEPWKGDGSEWFDLTPEGKKRLYERMFEPPFGQSAELRVPKKYSITFRLKCAEGCWTREPPYKFLVDVGVSHDGYEWWDKEDPAMGEEQLDRPVTRAGRNAETTATRKTAVSGAANGLDDMPLVLLNPETEEPYRHQPYTIQLTDRVIDGTTDENGATRPLTSAERASVVGWHLDSKASGMKKAQRTGR